MISDFIKLRPDLSRQPIPDVSSFTPIISNADVVRGEIVRYFARPSGSTDVQDILEISPTTFQQLKGNSGYRITSIRWKISGKLDDIISLTTTGDPYIFYKGVLSCNKDIVKLANDELPGLIDYIRNYKRFWQGE